jgi:hypothetical protein
VEAASAAGRLSIPFLTRDKRMADRSSCTRRLLAPLAAVSFALSLPGAAQETPGATPEKPAGTQAQPEAKAQPEAQPQPAGPKKRDRVYVKDLEGTWIARDYLERLRLSRAPHATARQATGIAIKIEREGPSYPILITDFHKAVLNFIIDVQPDVSPKSYRLAVAKQDRPGISSAEVTYISFRGERNPDGVFQALLIAEPNFAKRRLLTYLRLNEPLENFVNRAVIAGQYQDAEGVVYEFTEQGEAILPDRSFAYEVSLDPATAACELLVSHHEREPQGDERIGFAWKGAELHLFKVTGKKPPYKCASKPFAVLARR